VSSTAPRSLAEAVDVLAAAPASIVAAGCTDLMVKTPLERAAAGPVLDVLRVAELRGIREVDGGVEIGATTTFREIGDSPVVREVFPSLAAAARVVGGWQIQERATIGGNAANASPAGDSLPVLLALGATVVCAGTDGRREVPYDAFHTAYRRTALAPGELIAAFLLPRPAAGSVQAFRKVGTRQAQAISKLVVAMRAELEDGTIRRLRLAAGSVAPVPLRLVAVEDALAGRRLDEETVELARRTAAAAVEPIDDVRSTAAYRRWALGNVVARMVAGLSVDRRSPA
jgi:CO/xanthine dehydrogenase FAD-binding subunit